MDEHAQTHIQRNTSYIVIHINKTHSVFHLKSFDTFCWSERLLIYSSMPKCCLIHSTQRDFQISVLLNQMHTLAHSLHPLPKQNIGVFPSTMTDILLFQCHIFMKRMTGKNISELTTKARYTVHLCIGLNTKGQY